MKCTLMDAKLATEPTHFLIRKCALLLNSGHWLDAQIVVETSSICPQQDSLGENVHFNRDNISRKGGKKDHNPTFLLRYKDPLKSYRRFFHLWLNSHTMWCFYMTEECRPNPETWCTELKLHFFVASARETGKRKSGFILKNWIQWENEGLCVTSLCEMFLFLLLLHWYLPDNYDCIKPLYWFILDRHICIMAWGALAGFFPRSLPPFWIEVFNVCPELQTCWCYYLCACWDNGVVSDCIVPFFTLLPAQRSWSSETIHFSCLAHSFAQIFSLLFRKNRIVFYFFSKIIIIIKWVICTCCLAMRESILEVTAVPKSRLCLYSCFFSSLN